MSAEKQVTDLSQVTLFHTTDGSKSLLCNLATQENLGLIKGSTEEIDARYRLARIEVLLALDAITVISVMGEVFYAIG